MSADPAPALSVVATPSIGSPTTSMSGWPVPPRTVPIWCACGVRKPDRVVAWAFSLRTRRFRVLLSRMGGIGAGVVLYGDVLAGRWRSCCCAFGRPSTRSLRSWCFVMSLRCSAAGFAPSVEAHGPRFPGLPPAGCYRERAGMRSSLRRKRCSDGTAGSWHAAGRIRAGVLVAQGPAGRFVSWFCALRGEPAVGYRPDRRRVAWPRGRHLSDERPRGPEETPGSDGRTTGGPSWASSSAAKRRA